MNVGVTSTPVTASHETDAFLAPGASVTVNGGPLTFQATAGSSATANSQSIDIGVANIASLSADTVVSGGTRAYAGNGAVLHSGNVSFLANSTDNAVASESSVGASLLGIVKLDPQAINEQAVEAYLGVGSNVQASGTLTVSATSTEGTAPRPTARRGPSSACRTSAPRRPTRGSRRPTSTARSRPRASR